MAQDRIGPVYEHRTTRHRIAELPKPIRSPMDTLPALRALLDGRQTEALAVIVLDTKNHPIAAEVVYTGNVSSSLVRVGELFRLAVRMNGSGLILAHNHPSGDPTPSPDDLHLTAEALAAGRLLDIQLLDHVIVADDGAYVSMRDRGIDFDRPGAAPAARESAAEYGPDGCPDCGHDPDEHDRRAEDGGGCDRCIESGGPCCAAVDPAECQLIAERAHAGRAPFELVARPCARHGADWPAVVAERDLDRLAAEYGIVPDPDEGRDPYRAVGLWPALFRWYTLAREGRSAHDMTASEWAALHDKHAMAEWLAGRGCPGLLVSRDAYGTAILAAARAELDAERRGDRAN